jgi:hypothetical protein
LRRLFGGADRPAEPEPEEEAARKDEGAPEDEAVAERAASGSAVDADERARELELMRAEQARLDALAERQLRYAEHAWRPPRQGGERRADDEDKSTAE